MKPLTVPMDTTFNIVLVQATIGDSPPLWFILDTGCDVPGLLDTKLAGDLGLPVGETSVEAQPGGDVVVAPIEETTICLAGQPMWNIPLLAFDFTPLAAFAGRPLHGLLGHQAIAGYVIELDYRAGTMTLSPPDHVPPSDTSVPLTLGPTAVDDAAALVAGTMTTLDGRPGDLIHAIDGRPVSEIGADGFFRMTRTGKPASHILRVERDGRLETVGIALRERI